jgi:ABC-type antimicrobial peptide transport system permease subunit
MAKGIVSSHLLCWLPVVNNYDDVTAICNVTELAMFVSWYIKKLFRDGISI